MHRVIPVRAKIFSAIMMTLSLVYVATFVAEGWVLPTFLASIMIPAAAYVMTRASAPPLTAASDVAAHEEGSVGLDRFALGQVQTDNAKDHK